MTPFQERYWRKENGLPPVTRKYALKEAYQDLAHFEKPAERLLELLSPQLEARIYDSILSDDGSARLHSLLLGQAIQDIYGDGKRLQIVFVQGGTLLFNDKPLSREISGATLRRSPLLREELRQGRVRKVEEHEDASEEDEEHPDDSSEDTVTYLWESGTTHAQEVRAYLERMKPKLGSNVLIVTEEIHSGRTIDALASMLRDMNIYAEAAAFGTSWEEIPREMPYITNGVTPVYIPLANIGPTAIEGSLGVRERQRSGLGHPLADFFTSPTDDKPIPEVRFRINAARQVIRELGHTIAGRYLQRHR